MKRHSRLRILSYLMAAVMLLGSFTGHIMPAKASDVSSLAKVKLMSFSVGNQAIVSNGELNDGYSGPIEVTSETEYRLEYKFSIDDKDLSKIKQGNTLTFTMPAWLNHNKGMTRINEFASYSVEGNRITVTFSKDLANYHSAEGGFSFWAKNNNTDETQNVIINYAEDQTVSIQLKKKPEGSGGSGGGTSNNASGHPDNFKPNRNKNVFLKEGAVERTGRVFYTFSVNYSELQKIYRNPSNINEKQNVVLVDELPKEWVHSNDMEFSDIIIEAPLYPPSTEDNGSGVFSVTDELSENKIDRYYAYRVNNGHKEGIFDLLEEKGDNTEEAWNAFKAKIANKPGPTIGVWNKTKLVIHFGELPYKGYGNVEETRKHTYGALMYQFDQTLDNYIGKSTPLTDKQIGKMKDAYRNQGLVAFDVTVYANVLNYTANTPDGHRVYHNDATLTWSEGKSTVHSNPVYVKGDDAWFNALPGKKRDIVIKKVWNPSEKSDTITEIKVDLIKDLTGNGESSDDTPVQSNIVLDEAGGWQKNVTGLRKYDDTGAEIRYYVREREVPGFKASYSDIYEGGEFKGFQIKNTKETTPPVTPQPEQKISLLVKKNWDGVTSDQQPESLEFVLKQTVNGVTKEVELFTMKKDSGWEWQKEKLPRLEGENKIVYSVEEKNSGTYKVTYTEMSEPDSSNRATIIVTNKKNESPITPEEPQKVEKVTLIAEKNWVGINPSKAPEITVGLYKDGTQINTAVLNSVSGWKVGFENLPAKEEGKTVRYTLREETVLEGYTSSMRIASEQTEEIGGESILTRTVLFTNKKKAEEPKNKEKINIAVQKEWVGLGTQPAPDVSFELMKNGTKVQDLTLTRDNLIGIFKGLDKFDEGGALIRYTVKEKKIEGFNESHTITENKTIKTNDGMDIPVTYYKFTNTTDSLKNIQLNVEKRWVGAPLDEVTFALMKNDVDTNQRITLNASNGWKGSFGLLARTEGGVPVKYDIKELTMSGYQVSYTGTTGERTVNNELVEFKDIIVTNTRVSIPNEGTPNIIIPINPNPLTPPNSPDYPTFIPPEIPKEVEEFLLEDEDVVRASVEEEPEEEDNEDFEIDDNLPRVNKDVPKTHDYIGNGFANPLAVTTVLMMGYGLKRLLKKNKKND